MMENVEKEFNNIFVKIKNKNIIPDIIELFIKYRGCDKYFSEINGELCSSIKVETRYDIDILYRTYIRKLENSKYNLTNYIEEYLKSYSKQMYVYMKNCGIESFIIFEETKNFVKELFDKIFDILYKSSILRQY